MRLRIGRWTIEHDPDATRACYARIPEGPACAPCPSCENYIALREGDLPAEFWKLLDTLGIAFAKPAELCLAEPAAGQWVNYSLWYHFVGRIISGADCWKPTSETFSMYDGEKIAPNLSLGFSSRRELVNDAFAADSIVQLEVVVNAPWVLNIFSHPYYEPWFEALNRES